MLTHKMARQTSRNNLAVPSSCADVWIVTGRVISSMTIRIGAKGDFKRVRPHQIGTEAPGAD